MVTELTDATFDDFVENNKTVIIDCWAPWCGPCRRMTPIMEELSVELKDTIGVAKLNVDDNPSISARFSIRSIPTVLVFKDQILVDTLVGLRPKEDILEYLKDL